MILKIMFGNVCKKHRSFLNESFSSRKLSSLFKNKGNLNVFKSVFSDFGTAWSDIEDRDVRKVNVSDVLKKYMSTTMDSEEMYYLIKGGMCSDDVLSMFVCDGDIIRIGNLLSNRCCYMSTDKNYIDNESLKNVDFIWKKYSRRDIPRDSCFDDYLDFILYEQDQCADYIKTFYKAFILCCYDILWDYLLPEKLRGISLAILDYQFSPDGDYSIYALRDLFDCVCRHNYSSCVVNVGDTSVSLTCDDIEYEFDFSMEGLSFGDIISNVEKYADMLCAIDKKGFVKNNVFTVRFRSALSVASVLYGCKYGVNQKLDTESLYVAMALLTFCVMSGDVFFCKVIYLSYVKDKSIDVYSISGSDHMTRYYNKTRQRQLNKIRGVDSHPQYNGVDELKLNKDMLRYIYAHDDKIRAMFKTIGGGVGETIEDVYDDMLLLDKYHDNTDMTVVHIDDAKDFLKMFNECLRIFIDVILSIDGGKKCTQEIYGLRSRVEGLYISYIDLDGPKENKLKFGNK